MHTYRPKLQRRGRIFQIVGRYYGQGHFFDHDGPTAYGKESLRVAQHLASVHETVGVICYKNALPMFAEAFGEANVASFGALRGTNTLEGRDGLIVIGELNPPSRAVINEAAAMNPKRMEPYRERNQNGDLTLAWRPQEVVYQLTPEGRQHAKRLYGKNTPTRLVGGYEDTTLKMIHQQICDAEVTQAIHRSRVNFLDVVVWLLSPVPLLDESIDWIADEPPLLPQRWLDGEFDSGNPIPLFRWLDLLNWGLLEKLDRGEYVTYEMLGEGAGVSLNWTRCDKWIDKLAKFMPDRCQVDKIKVLKGRGGPRKALAGI